MNWIDWTIIAVLGLSTLVSLKRGFVNEALSLGAWVAAFVVAVTFGGALATALAEQIANDTVRYLLAYVLLFVLALMLGSWVARLASRVVKVTDLEGVDRALGTVFGLARGVVVLLVMLFVYREVVPPQEQQALRESRLAPHLLLVEAWARQTFADAVNGAVGGGVEGGAKDAKKGSPGDPV